jgi:ADP-ribose pyrophosphatase YjhB (NUDIX family)
MSDDPLTIRPGVAAVVRNGRDEILLHRRPAEDGWAPPSGAVEPGEAVQAALRRELREETTLEVTIEGLVGLYSDPAFQIVRATDGPPVHFVTSLFACRVQSGTLQGSVEGTAWAWFPPGDLPSPLLPYAETWLDDAVGDGGAEGEASGTGSVPVVR